ncbi:MAG: hypothetical protein GYA51_16740 [Candidatus Methanofastidiosa archaeon]|jgi:hypothetical protein|nr:hypothetical protein [Candidatus Methanofastidiosa archaeon]
MQEESNMFYSKGSKRFKQKIQSRKTRKLNMGRVSDFKWDLNQVLNKLPEDKAGLIRGPLYAKASKIGVEEAKKFLKDKEEEGIIDKEIGVELLRVLTKYSKFR